MFFGKNKNTAISIHALLAESDIGNVDVPTFIYGFLSTLSLRRATHAQVTAAGVAQFLSTLSLRRATHQQSVDGDSGNDFYPRSPCGERPAITRVRKSETAFLSTLSLRRATPHAIKKSPRSIISIHALLAESDFLTGCLFNDIAKFLSTLSLRRATAVRLLHGQVFGISIHALLAESDTLPPHQQKRGNRFLSTLSLRRATH